jgi:hypothetical protein
LNSVQLAEYVPYLQSVRRHAPIARAAPARAHRRQARAGRMAPMSTPGNRALALSAFRLQGHRREYPADVGIQTTFQFRGKTR